MIVRLMTDGYYLNAAAFPAVPLGDGGIRFAQTLHNTREQLTGLMDAIERHLPEVVPEYGTTSETEIVLDLRDEADITVEGSDTPG